MISSAGGVYALLQTVEEDGSTDGHSHDFDHVSVLVRGSITVNWHYPDDVWAKLEAAGKLAGRTKVGSMDFAAPAAFPVLAGVLHQYVATSAGGFEVWCIHATRDADGSVIGATTMDKYLGHV